MTYPIIHKGELVTVSATSAFQYSQGTNGGAGNKLVFKAVTGLTGTIQVSYDGGSNYLNVDTYDDDGNFYVAGSTITFAAGMELFWEGAGGTHVQITKVGGTSATVRLVSTFAPWGYMSALLKRIAGASTVDQPNVDSYTQVAINLAAGANQSVISAPGANKQIWVYGGCLMANVAGTVSIQDEDDTAITGIMQLPATGGWSSSPSGNLAMPIWKVATNKALEMDIVTSEIDGWLTYGIVSV